MSPGPTSFTSSRTALSGGLLANEEGKTMAELITAMTVTTISMAAMYGLLTIQSNMFINQDYAVDMEQYARIAMEMIGKDLKMAGYKPMINSTFDGITYSASQLEIRADKNGDGDVLDAEEYVTYSFNASAKKLVRGGTGNKVEIPDIQSFTFSFFDAGGALTTTTSSIREVSVTITARSVKPDPKYSLNDGYRTFTLSSRFTPRNLGL
jgi:hypothetical protein